jgi:dihydroorotate dehydrogenase (fumarate)
MADVSTTYLGLSLQNPIIAGSSGLTSTLSGVQDLADHGIAAVVLRSIYEEEIAFEFDEVLREAAPGTYQTEYMDYFDYYDYQVRQEYVDRYLRLIQECKASVSIPVIASVNCVYSYEWANFARELEVAGADALELNMFFLPSDFSRNVEATEQAYFEVIERVLDVVSVPVALKISTYFTDLGPMIQRLSKTGIAGLVLFNRFWSPDIDIDNLQVVSTNMFSSPDELTTSLRWIAIMAHRVQCDLAASTGVHDGEALIKQLLVGADAVQVVSSLYKNGKDRIGEMLDDLESWMTSKGYDSLDDFRGQMSQAQTSNPAAFERMQFMKYFGGRR